MACACGNDSCSCQPPETIHLKDQVGIVHPFYIADKLFIGERQYAFAVSLEESEQYALLRVETGTDGKNIYQNISDEAEWATIQEYLARVQ